MFSVRMNKHNLLNPVIETDWQWLLRLAWGKRRVSSRASDEFFIRYNNKYSRTTAALSLWLRWIYRTLRYNRDYVLIDTDKEGYGVAYAMELIAAAKKEQEEAARNAMAKRLDDLQAQRAKARAERDFELADRLRDEIVAAGFIVSDEKLK